MFLSQRDMENANKEQQVRPKFLTFSHGLVIRRSSEMREPRENSSLGTLGYTRTPLHLSNFYIASTITSTTISITIAVYNEGRLLVSSIFYFLFTLLNRYLQLEPITMGRVTHITNRAKTRRVLRVCFLLLSFIYSLMLI